MRLGGVRLPGRRADARRTARGVAATVVASVLLIALGACTVAPLPVLDESGAAPFFRRSFPAFDPALDPASPRAVLDESRLTLTIDRNEFAGCPVEPTAVSFDDDERTFRVRVEQVPSKADRVCDLVGRTTRTEVKLQAVPAPGPLTLDIVEDGHTTSTDVTRVAERETLEATTTMPPSRQYPAGRETVALLAEVPRITLSADGLTLSVTRADSTECAAVPTAFAFDGEHTLVLEFGVDLAAMNRVCSGEGIYLTTAFDLPAPLPPAGLSATVEGLGADTMRIAVDESTASASPRFQDESPFFRTASPPDFDAVESDPLATLSADGRILTVVRIESPYCPRTPAELSADGGGAYVLTFERALPSSDPYEVCPAVASVVRFDLPLDAAPPGGDLTVELRDRPWLGGTVVVVEREN